MFICNLKESLFRQENAAKNNFINPKKYMNQPRMYLPRESGKMTKILIVDDNDDLRALFRLILANFEIYEAKNGLEAIEHYDANKPDLVLMDILMPEMDGIVATKKILEKNPDAIVVAITAYSSRANEIITAGAKEVLKKPVRKQELILKIKEYTDKD
jgi:CheY-like chemotaxis protein